MSDWEVVNDAHQEQIAPQRSDWSAAEPQKEEEGFWHKLPRNVGIGLVHAGRNLHNLPHDIAHLGDVVGSEIGRFFGAPEFQNGDSDLASYLPYDPKDYSDVFGEHGNPTEADKLIRKGVEIAPDVIGGINALRSLKLLPHLTRKGASKNIVKARELGKKRNMGPLDVNPDLIEDTRQFLPNTTPYRNLIDEAGYGDYNRLFSLQSDLGKHAGGMSKDWFSKANRAHGRAGLEVRGNILNEMKNSMRQQGHGDIADLLTKGQDEYRRYMKFKPYRNALLAAGAAYSLPRNVLMDLVKKFATMGKD